MQILPSVQMLRAFAALAVVIHHTVASFRFEFVGQTNSTGIPIGAAGVDIFFIISGFIMVLTSQNIFAVKSETIKNSIQYNFIIKRLIRIVPLYWLLMTLFIIVSYFGHKDEENLLELSRVLKSYAFIPYARLDHYMHPILRVGWTLNYELMFYLLFAYFLHMQLTRAVICLSLTLGAVSLINPYTEPFSALSFWTNPIIMEFAIGALLGLAYLKNIRLSKPIQVLAVISGLAILWSHTGPVIEPDITRLINWGSGAALIFVGCVFGKQSNTLPSNKLVLIGNASYAMYLLHFLIIHLFLEYIIWNSVTLNKPNQLAFAFATLAITIGLSIILHLYVEKPVQKILRNKFLPTPPQN